MKEISYVHTCLSPVFSGTCLTSPTHFHSTREIQSATAMPSISEVKWIAVHFNVELALLFISASTPTAMYINPPAVNPCKNNISLRDHDSQKVISFTNAFLAQCFSPQWKMTAQDLVPKAKPTATAENRFLFQTFEILIAKDFVIPRKTNLPLQFLLVPRPPRGSWRRELWGRWNQTSQEYQNRQPAQGQKNQMNQVINSLEQNKNNDYDNIKILKRIAS